MAYTAEQLVIKSWYLSGIVARNLQTPTGDQINDGLSMLNDLLNFKQVELDLLPYWQYIQLELTSGQEFYYLPYVADVESATFNLDVVRFPMQETQRRAYYGGARVDNISALPFNWNFNRALGGGNIGLYFLPQSNYPMKMMVKLFFTDVSLTTDLTNITESFSNPNNIPFFSPYTFVNSDNQGFDTSYIEYLRYALARYMCSEYGIVFNPQSELILKSMENALMYVSPPDMTIRSACLLGSNKNGDQGYNWGDCNIGRGWRP